MSIVNAFIYEWKKTRFSSSEKLKIVLSWIFGFAHDTVLPEVFRSQDEFNLEEWIDKRMGKRV